MFTGSVRQFGRQTSADLCFSVAILVGNSEPVFTMATMKDKGKKGGEEKKEKEARDKEMEDLAQSTALTIAETTQAAKQLLISFDPRNIKDLIVTLGNISSGMDNVSLQDMAFLLQTSRTEGKLLARDLRQFTTRGINLTGALGDVFGLKGVDAGEKVTEMVTAGEVGIQHVMKALQLLGSNNMLARQANTLTGAFNQAKDAVGLMLRDFGEVLSETLGLTGFLQSMKDRAIAMREAIRSNLPVIQMMIETFQSMGSAVIQVFSDAAATIWIFTGAADLSTTQIIEGFIVAMAVIRSVFTNWRTWGQLAVLAVALEVEKWILDIEHAFTVKLPAYLSWFGDNWLNVFVTAGLLTMQTIVNLGANIGEFLNQVWQNIKTWGKHGWDPMFVSLDRGFEEIKKKYGPDSLPDVAPRGKSVLEEQLEDGIRTTAGQAVTEMDKEIKDSLERYRSFVPDKAPPGLGEPVAEQFAERGKGKTGKEPSELGAMQRGSKESIQAVLKAMGGRDKSPEVIELKRQTMMLKYFGDQLRREERYAELHPQGPV